MTKLVRLTPRPQPCMIHQTHQTYPTRLLQAPLLCLIRTIPRIEANSSSGHHASSKSGLATSLHSLKATGRKSWMMQVRRAPPCSHLHRQHDGHQRVQMHGTAAAVDLSISPHKQAGRALHPLSRRAHTRRSQRKRRRRWRALPLPATRQQVLSHQRKAR
jgi:hypothetical protein